MEWIIGTIGAIIAIGVYLVRIVREDIRDDPHGGFKGH